MSGRVRPVSICEKPLQRHINQKPKKDTSQQVPRNSHLRDAKVASLRNMFANKQFVAPGIDSIKEETALNDLTKKMAALVLTSIDFNKDEDKEVANIMTPKSFIVPKTARAENNPVKMFNIASAIRPASFSHSTSSPFNKPKPSLKFRKWSKGLSLQKKIVKKTCGLIHSNSNNALYKMLNGTIKTTSLIKRLSCPVS